jgi:hypothetical protein
MIRMTRGVLGFCWVWIAFLAWSGLSAAAEPSIAESRKPQIPELKIETYTPSPGPQDTGRLGECLVQGRLKG